MSSLPFNRSVIFENYMFSPKCALIGSSSGNYVPVAASYDTSERFYKNVIIFDKECFLPTVGFFPSKNIIRKAFFTINDNQNTKSIEIATPLYIIRKSAKSKNTGEAIFTALVRPNGSMRGLTHVYTNKGCNFYGCPGLILDESMNPMIITGYRIIASPQSASIIIITPLCYVSPTVFSSRDTLSRFIINKVIPYYSSEGAPVWCIEGTQGITIASSYREKVPIVIEDLNHLLSYPTPPKDIDNLDNDIWKLLNDNISDVL